MVNTTIIGNLVADPRIGEYNGRQMASANVAVHTPFKDASGNYITNFYEVSVWGPQRDTLARMKKGNKLAATGSVCVKPFNKKDGTTGFNITMNANSIESLTYQPNNGNGNTNYNGGNSYNNSNNVEDLFSGN